jgi:two-component system sensor histidine kinase/response regulator
MNKKILVVDDDADIVELTKTILELDGFDVLTAFSGGECLQLLEKENVDLVLLDIMMPEISGWDVAAKMKENPLWDEIPIVFLTAKGDTMSIGMGGMASEDYIVKPFDKDALLYRIKKILEDKEENE